MLPRLSVVIPIYKVEKYLEHCVRSVLYQDFHDIEVILVDDGSPDSCPIICDKLAKEDDRIRVIHKSNAGLSSARNAGLQIAKGKYVIFLDSDDCWAEGKLKTIIEMASKEDADIYFIKSLTCSGDGILRERFDNGIFKFAGKALSRTELYPLLIREGNLHEQAGTHICKTSFLKENHLFYQDGILGEDTEWMFRMMRVVGKMIIIDDYLQIYTSGRPGSITNSVRPKSLADLITVIDQSLTYYKDHNSDVKQWELAQCSFLWATSLGFYAMIDKKERKQFKPKLKTQFKQLPLNIHPKARIAQICYRLLGFEITSSLLRIFIVLRKKNIIPRTKAIK